MAAEVAGAGAIVVTDVQPRGWTRRPPRATDLVTRPSTAMEQIRDLTGGLGVDFSVESTGLPEVMAQAVAALAPWEAPRSLCPAGRRGLRTNAFACLRQDESRSSSPSGTVVLVPRVLTCTQGPLPAGGDDPHLPLDDINRPWTTCVRVDRQGRPRP